ncbi:sulfotransferase [Phaeobacter gallaeciensis]|jgi:tetratricopeptide (TPR) repeat protein|uniref:tetratricopeptide repeat-containing sulfotransferase family protein n=2 Tax=Phaeobacter gallaeciensis TaxID=60890 RepID=UPI00237EE9D3|nr:tetratricopeptide repeat-containing sulfotransferase family protein [Phaeobacter gallaeciensis]MDE4305636.1 sulfotransferase [Phaeobacter gallaeciensis]MDE4309984.1 sulfotransferase [Phaeobacter gallaeciensis]MDE4314441.1 sulfotransferase [Phaeobacter gallaeciensis]MDE4318716.1 sulfotransferase [Phaeobacter gallaeciensis]MDE4322878.1 sulfotransferase [Phaeobacter gallaeciensis]
MIASRDLGIATSYLNSGAYKPALKIAKRLQKTTPRDPHPFNIAGICLSAMNKLPEAIAQFQRAMKIDPGFVDARHNLAQTLILSGRHAQAIRVVEPLRDGDATACFFLAQAHVQLGDLTAASAAIEQAVALRPSFAPAQNLRGLILTNLGEETEAIVAYETALASDPNNVETLVNISLPLARQNRHDEGHRMAERAVQLAPDHIGARLRLGTSFIEAGAFLQAKEQFHAVLAIQPGQAQALEQLSLLLDGAEMADMAAPAQKALSKVRSGSLEAAELNFALSRIEDAMGERQAAILARRRANGILAKHMPYDGEADARQTDHILNRFPAVTPAEANQPDGPLPIYVLGLPRSGTSLVEAMLSRLPKVETMGERAATGFLVQDFLESDKPFDTAAAWDFAHRDAARLPTCPEGTRAYVDKMPENYRYIGFLKTAYPHCRIVHVRRDPRDVALSMWKSHFTGTALSYTYDQTGLARRVGLYARLMQHWQTVFPDQILTVDYEDLVTDPVAGSRAIAEYCGLDWTPEMAAPEGSSAPTLTMSASQIRQPVHQRSIGSWRAQADELAEFLEALDTSLWPDLAD